MYSTSKISGYLKLGLYILFSGIAALYFFLSPEEKGLFPECVFHSVTGYYCPGCGSQRAIHNFLHLNISGVISNNMLFLPGMMIVFYGVFLPVINKKLGTNYRNFLYYKWTPLILFIIIVLFAILRNISFYPFTLLAPG